MKHAVLGLGFVAALATGCPVDEACRASDECEGAARCIEGRCEPTGDGGAPVGDGGAGEDAASIVGTDAGGDAGEPPAEDAGRGDDAGMAPIVDAGPRTDGGTNGTCTPVDDEVLTSAESPIVLGVGIRYLSAGSEDSPVSVDLVGETADDGVIEWDFSTARPSDVQLILEAEPFEGFWFEDGFTDVSHVAQLDVAGESYGIFRRTDDALLLLGVASAEEDYTLLTYDPPVTVFRYPLAEGDSWTEETDVDGTFEGNPYYLSTDTYETVVDATGRVKTNAGTFPVLRVRVHQTLRIPILVYPFELVYETWKYAFLTPCLGQVAFVASRLDESSADFTQASEVRRVGLW